MGPLHFLAFAFGAFLFGAAGSFVWGKRGKDFAIWGTFLPMLGAVAQAIAAVRVLLDQAPQRGELFGIVPGVSFELRIDALSSLFHLLSASLTLFVSLYGYGDWKLRGEYGRQTSIYGLCFCLFSFSSALLLSAASPLPFLLAWNGIVFTSYFLIALKPEIQAAQSASLRFLAFSALSLLGLTLAIFANGNVTEAFSSSEGVREARHGISALWIWGGLLLGTGPVLGLFPFQSWMPRAFAVSPSAVSALLSAGLVNLGIYVCIRLGLQVFSKPPIEFGICFILIGVLSRLVGSVYSAVELELKRLFAWNSLANLGLLAIDFGLAVIARSIENEELYRLSLGALLFQVTLQTFIQLAGFFAAGNVAAASGNTNLKKSGGLIHSMPWTGFLFTMTAWVSISLPGFGGFVGQWLTLQPWIAGWDFGGFWIYVTSFALLIVLLTSLVLSSLAFLRVMKTVFLSPARSREVESTREFPWLKNVFFLSVCTAIAISLMPVSILSFATPAVEALSIRSDAAVSWTALFPADPFWIVLWMIWTLGSLGYMLWFVWNRKRRSLIPDSVSEVPAIRSFGLLFRAFFGIETFWIRRIWDPSIRALRWAAIRPSRFKTESAKVHLALFLLVSILILAVVWTGGGA